MSMTDSSEFAHGKAVETILDVWFSYQKWDITPTTAHEERVLCLGDRRFSRNGETLLVEYKADLKTILTGNIFLETVSVDTANKQGWVYSCKAHYILYACLFNNKILVFRPQRLRDNIENLKAKFPTKGTNRNANYTTSGVIVPLKYAIDHLAEKVIPIFGK